MKLQEVPAPQPKANEVLIKVKSAGINSWDWDNLTGKELIVRLLWGITSPRIKIMGCDVSGIIESIGEKVTEFEVGDEVLGDLSESGWSCFAEYTTAKTSSLVKKPPGLSFEAAAALPQAGVMALQGVREFMDLKPGVEVLMNGAGGGFGTYFVQLVKATGATITAVDRREKLPLLKKLGADHIIEYPKEDIYTSVKAYDLIIDVAASKKPSVILKILNKGGTYAAVGGKMSRLFSIMFFGKFFSRNQKRITILSHKPNRYLEELADIVAEGKLKSTIDGPYSLNELPSALRKIGTGEVIGKIVINP